MFVGMKVTSLRVYPVKSMAGIDVDVADVEPWGLAGDRRWGVVDEFGTKITAREMPALLGLSAEPVANHAVRIRDRAGQTLVVESPRKVTSVLVSHSRQGSALPANDRVNEWLSVRLDRPVRLVWQDDPTVRSIAEDHGGAPGESLSLADAGPLLLTSEASMRQLNAWIFAEAEAPDVPDIDPADMSGPALPTAPLSIVRFRPNIVIDGGEPFAEETWPAVTIGDITFRTTMVCDRCVMTTIDPVTLAGGKEPIRTLARHRRRDGKTWFGIRLVAVQPGQIKVGDPVSGSVGPGT
jgi:uncharacterized protein YcbX